jgi:hypothetical protein
MMLEQPWYRKGIPSDFAFVLRFTPENASSLQEWGMNNNDSRKIAADPLSWTGR